MNVEPPYLANRQKEDGDILKDAKDRAAVNDRIGVNTPAICNVSIPDGVHREALQSSKQEVEYSVEGEEGIQAIDGVSKLFVGEDSQVDEQDRHLANN